MKKLILFVVILFAVSASAVVAGQSVLAESSEKVSYKLAALETLLRNVDREPMDRNSRLRLQRAEYYFSRAAELQEANWDQRALEHIRRSNNLLQLRASELESAM